MNAKLEPNKTQSQATEHTLTVYFFKGELFLVRLLQLLVGGSWGSPTHVVYAVDDISYEITTKGLVVGGTRPEVLYRACEDCLTFPISAFQAYMLMQYFEGIMELKLKFSVWECVSYCWRLLVLNAGSCFSFFDVLDFGQVERTQPYEACYCPPFSCTTPMWEAVGVQPASWNAFVPAVLYDCLTQTTTYVTEEEDFSV